MILFAFAVSRGHSAVQAQDLSQRGKALLSVQDEEFGEFLAMGTKLHAFDGTHLKPRFAAGLKEHHPTIGNERATIEQATYCKMPKSQYFGGWILGDFEVARRIMKIEFRLVHFVPDPFSGARIPVGALVRTDSGTEVVIPDKIPGQGCLHGGAAANLKDLLNDLRQLKTFPQSVGSLSQHLVQTELKSIQIDVSVKEWFERAFFPVSDRKAKDHLPQQRRSTEGKLFLKQYGVDALVQSTFRPNDFWTSSGHSAAFKALKPISQYVGSADTELLLMEPLVPHRASFQDDVSYVNTQFAAYRFYMDETQSRSASLVVYILPDEDQRQREYAIEALSDSAHVVVDASKEAQRKDFIERIRSTGPKAMLL